MSINWKIVLVLVLATVTATFGTSRSKFEEGLLKVLEKCKKGDVGSLPIAIPSLKSFKLDPMQINYDGYTVDLSDSTVKGLEHLTVEKLSASESDLTVSLAFNVPTMDIRADNYHLQGKAFLLTINDRGEFKANVRNLRAKAVVQFGAAGSNTVIKRLNIDYSVGGVQAQLGGSSSIVNSVFNSKLSKMLSENKSVVTSKAKHIIEKMVNKMLEGFTPAKLVEIISKV